MEKDKFFMNSSGFGMEIQAGELNSAAEEQQLQNCFFNPTWENSVDQNDPFESALSSIVSSPAASNAGTGGEGVMIRELIGRLGSICNSGEISPESYIGANNSRNTSCYSTPLNSPPKLNLSMMDQQIRGNLPIPGNQLPSHPTLARFSADPGFAERAARFSCFGGRNLAALNGQLGLNEAELPYRSTPRIDSGKLSRVSSNNSFKLARSQPANAQEQSPENAELGDSREGSSVSEQIPAAEMSVKAQNETNGRKRKSIPRGKAKENPLPSAKDNKIAAENEESKAKAKRSKQESDKDGAKEEASESGKSGGKDNNSKPPEPPKDYIHVRARRGQATDSHSLAERVRREKISERMKFLQDLVPGCNKVTGKAVMLDEIINYVQSLQRQVEFLSMKLSTVNPRMEFNMEALMSKEILQSRGSLPQSAYPLESSAPAFPFGYQQVAGISNGTSMQLPLPPMDGFGEPAPPQLSGFWEDDLQSLVQMGFGPNQAQNFHGSMAASQMKLEL